MEEKKVKIKKAEKVKPIIPTPIEDIILLKSDKEVIPEDVHITIGCFLDTKQLTRAEKKYYTGNFAKNVNELRSQKEWELITNLKN
jgi:hypothetical protein